ncbi:hypothetical protein H4Q26_009876 [Puccinia striiformis f. sp. tritici PST-130]|nr:hypothetical protein H4Q26_009876 [Puccinia striiformis f. sp. tritici PST-130]
MKEVGLQSKFNGGWRYMPKSQAHRKSDLRDYHRQFPEYGENKLHMDQPSDDDEAHRPRQQGGGVAPPSPTSTRPGSPEVCDEVGYFMRTGLQNVLNLSGVPIIASDWCNAACNMIEVVIRYMETKKPGRLFASVLGARDEEGERRAEAREKKAEDRERRAEERERKAEERERKAEDREKELKNARNLARNCGRIARKSGKLQRRSGILVSKGRKFVKRSATRTSPTTLPESKPTWSAPARPSPFRSPN